MKQTEKGSLRRHLTRQQSNYIKGEARKRGLNMTGLAAVLEVPYGTLTGNVNGWKANPEVRRRIAAFLGAEVVEIFGGNGEIPPEPPAARESDAAEAGHEQ